MFVAQWMCVSKELFQCGHTYHAVPRCTNTTLISMLKFLPHMLDPYISRLSEYVPEGPSKWNVILVIPPIASGQTPQEDMEDKNRRHFVLYMQHA
jgi:hypothetical protein